MNAQAEPSNAASPDWLTEGAPHVWRPYCQHKGAAPPLPVVAAEGARLVLSDGRELVDGLASWWTAAHGYGDPLLRAAMQRQAAELAHVAFGGLAHRPAYQLAARLTQLVAARAAACGVRAPQERALEHVFYTESGSVAVEVALKMALQRAAQRGCERRTVIAFFGAYHGDTLATMALCDPHDGMHRAFAAGGQAMRVVHLPLPEDPAQLAQLVAPHAADLAAVVIEPLLQAAGGMILHDPAHLRVLRAACDAHDALLIFDEIAVGFHRLGPCFAFERAKLLPDVLVLGKALTGGSLPLAAVVASRALFAEFLGDDSARALQHGPTYMGNAMACAAALASLERFASEDYAARVAQLECKLQSIAEPLRKAPRVRQVRVAGAMLACELPPGCAPASERFAQLGVFLRPLRLQKADVVYLMPPLRIADHELQRLAHALESALL